MGTTPMGVGSNGGGSGNNGGSGGGGGGGGSGGGSGCNTATLTNAAGEYCHDYTTTTVVCPAEFACIEAEMQMYLTQFQYPGQLPWNSVQDLESYTVAPFNMAPLLGIMNPGLAPLSVALDQILGPYGAIWVDISDDGLSATNNTRSSHIFREGQVYNQLSQRPDGSWVVNSNGTGTNSNHFIANVNQ